ncbi:MAG: hypothetical protein WC358_03075 [Ignavibacteria bacterium]|jgi:hypothetical protein
MEKRKCKYYFGRFNLMANYTDKFDYIYSSFKKGNVILKRNFLWGFFAIDIIKDAELGVIITGFLVKYYPEAEEEVVNTKDHQLSIESLKDKVQAKARFFMIVKSGLIAFHPVSVKIEIDAFRKNFCEVFIQANDGFFVNADIELVQERYKIFEEIHKFNFIERVLIELHPSNPSLSEDWKEVDKYIKDLNASTIKEQYYANQKEKGLKIIENNDIRAKITMADDGYGNAEINGIIDDNQVTIKTKDNPITESAPTDEIENNLILNYLKNKFLNIFSRFKHNEN